MELSQQHQRQNLFYKLERFIKSVIRKLICCKFMLSSFGSSVFVCPCPPSLHSPGEHRWADKGGHSVPAIKLSAPMLPGKVGPNLYYMQKSVLSSNVVIQLVL